MKALGEVLKLACQYLQSKGIVSPKRDAEELLAYILKLKRLDLYLNFDRPMQEEELTLYRANLLRRAQGEPVEYILGEVEFFGCHLKVTPSVLIPRKETEILLDKICHRLASEDLKGKIAWDICAGSGCLGLGLKKKFENLQVALSDLSKEALEVAKINASNNKLNVTFLEGDLLSPFASCAKADIVVVNPPYISKKEFRSLDEEVKNFEPEMALVGGETGLEFYERLAKELPNYVNSKALVFCEIGHSQGEQVLSLFNATCFRMKSFEKDYAGHDRFFFLEFE